MKITQSTVAMQGRSEQIRQHEIHESLRQWKDDAPQVTPGSIRMSLSAAGYEKLRNELAQTGASATSTAPAAETAAEEGLFSLSDEDKAKIQLIEDFVYALTGKKMKVLIPKQISQKEAQSVQQGAMLKGEGPRRLGWGVDYQFHERIYEKEVVQFATAGSVTTEDGRAIDFQLAFSASREFLSETHVSLKAGDALVDPLMLNFSGPMATLGARDFRFDLDVDGEADTLSFAGEGSGFLALDRNENGTIDDGSELFGPQSGNGFEELAVFDGDKNGWIDENDAIFDKLRIWSMDGDGNLKLEALGQAGVGAIYLGNVTTPFQLTGTNGQADGQLARSGIYLRENGTAGTIQHVDLSV